MKYQTMQFTNLHNLKKKPTNISFKLPTVFYHDIITKPEFNIQKTGVSYFTIQRSRLRVLRVWVCGDISKINNVIL